MFLLLVARKNWHRSCLPLFISPTNELITPSKTWTYCPLAPQWWMSPHFCAWPPWLSRIILRPASHVSNVLRQKWLVTGKLEKENLLWCKRGVNFRWEAALGNKSGLKDSDAAFPKKKSTAVLFGRRRVYLPNAWQIKAKIFSLLNHLLRK